MSGGGETVLVEREGAVAWVVLNRPDVLNAWNDQLELELLDTLEQLADDADVRAVGVRGSGRAFCSGGDLGSMRTHAETGGAGVAQGMRERPNRIILALRAMPQPVVAAVHGSAAGIGCSFALACDLVIAADTARFLLAFVRVGLVPDGAAIRWIAQRAGRGTALEMALLGEPLDARRALALGLVNRCHPEDELVPATAELLERLAAGPTRAMAGIKSLADAANDLDLAALLDSEAELQERMTGTADFAEGVAAFLEKRAARFDGR